MMTRHPQSRSKPESRQQQVNMQPAVYILASKRNGTLYIGATSNLVKRVWEHKNDYGFTKRYTWFGMRYTRLWKLLFKEKNSSRIGSGNGS
jgi:predicted GIY-YIG superfamily endonuclease